MLSDKETLVDALGFEPYIDSLSKIVTEKGITPFTLGIFGSWGTGKTSLMLMLKEMLESKYNAKTVWFNAWKFHDEKQIWTALIQTILNQLESSLGWRTRRKLKELRERIEWIEVVTFLRDSMVAQRLDINALKKCFKPKKKVESIAEFEKKFEEIVKSLRVEKLVIFIDDLDRCRAGATLDILEAIKLLLNAKKCVFVLGLDYDRTCQAVSKRFVETENSQEVADDYIDKIIQLCFHIPQRTTDDMRLFLRYLYALQYIGKEKSQDFARDVRRIGKHIDEDFLTVLKNYIDTKSFPMDGYKALTEHESLIIKGTEFNPRKLKRFLNMYGMRISLSESLELDLESELLVKFLLLQIKFAGFCRCLESEPGLLKHILELIPMKEEERNKELKKLEKSKRYNVEDVYTFLKEASFRDVDPRPYLSIAQTAAFRIALGEKERTILKNLMSDDSTTINSGVKIFKTLNEKHMGIIVRDLLGRTEYTDAQVRKKSVKALGLLKRDIPESMLETIVRRMVALTEDDNIDVRIEAKKALGI